MSRRLIQAALVFLIVLAAAQLVRPEGVNRPIDPARTIQARGGTASGLADVLDRSCGDCHSNQMASGWYTRIAPLSWLMAHEVKLGRQAVNFSEWAGYPPDEQQKLLVASCRDASAGKMPGPYTLFRPETRLSAQDVETICAAANQTDTKKAAGR